MGPIIAFRLLVKEASGLEIPMEKARVSTRGQYSRDVGMGNRRYSCCLV